MKSNRVARITYLGMQTPLRRKLSRDIIKAQKAADWELIFKCWEQSEREFQYLAIDCLDKVKSTAVLTKKKPEIDTSKPQLMRITDG